MLARRPATAVIDPRFHLTVSSLCPTGLCDRRLDHCPGAFRREGALELNSTGRSLFGPGSGNGNPCYRIKIPCSDH
jgi:hypothetical protein